MHFQENEYSLMGTWGIILHYYVNVEYINALVKNISGKC